MSLFKKISAFSVLSMFILSFAAVPFVLAQDTAQQGGSGLQLSPTRSEITGQPGESKTFKISLKNVTQGEVTAQAFLNDFESDNNSGTPQIIVDETKAKTPYSIRDMIGDLQNVDLKAGETKEIENTINIPNDVAPGAYFGALRYAAVPVGQDAATTDRQVSLTASVAHLVFVEVPGDVVQKISIESLSIQNDDVKKSVFFKAPNKAALSVKNQGNGFSRPFGKVVLTRGSSEVYSYDVNNTDPKGIVLPNSTRIFTDEIKNVETPGKYKITGSVAYGNGGEVVSYETSFWYLPAWFLGAIALLLILIIGGGFFGYKKYIAKSGFKKSSNS